MNLDRRKVLQLATAFGGSLIASPFAFMGEQALAQKPASAEGAPQRGGVVTLVSFSEPTTLVPLADTNTRTSFISTKILEGLLRFDSKFDPQPVLATAWAVSPDGLRYTFNLREGVKWHDGKDFTSADVRFTLLAFKKHGPRGRITFANLEDVETPDPLTAVVVLSRPAPYLLRALTGGETPILPAHAYADGDYTQSSNGNAPIGTGPFVFEEWRRGSHVKLKRNENYWQAGLPYLDGFIARFVGDTAAITIALETGEADYTTDISFGDLERLKQNPALVVEPYASAYHNNASVFEFNLDNEILVNVKVRHALAHGIDRKFISDAVYYGTAKPAGSTIPAIFTAYNDEAPFTYPFDPAKANALLDEAGYPRGADGTRFSLRATFHPGQYFRRTAEYFRSAFGNLGIKVTVIDGDLAAYIRRVYTERGFDINLNGISRLFDPTVGVQRLYWSDVIKNVVPYANAAHYNNPKVDDLFRAASTEVDETKRAALFKQIQEITGAELPNFAVVELPTVIVCNARLQSLVTTIDVASSDLASAWKKQS